MNEAPEANKAPYNRQDEILADILNKKLKEFKSNYEIKEYLCEHYGYTEQTAQRYCENMWKKIKEMSSIGSYEEELASTIHFMHQLVNEEKNSYIRLQILKELNKIKGLHIQKIQVEGGLQNITTIKINSVKPAEQLNEGETITNNVPLTDSSELGISEQA